MEYKYYCIKNSVLSTTIYCQFNILSKVDKLTNLKFSNSTIYIFTFSKKYYIYIYIYRVILWYPSKKEAVRYQLVGNLLYQVTFFITFDGSILTLCSSNITCDSSFLTFGSSLTFFSHLTVPSSHCAVSISHVTVLVSHLIVPLLFFSHI